MISNSGTINVTSGNIDTAMIAVRIKLRRGKRRRAMAYAASALRTMLAIIDSSATMALFIKYTGKG